MKNNKMSKSEKSAFDIIIVIAAVVVSFVQLFKLDKGAGPIVILLVMAAVIVFEALTRFRMLAGPWRRLRTWFDAKFDGEESSKAEPKVKEPEQPNVRPPKPADDLLVDPEHHTWTYRGWVECPKLNPEDAPAGKVIDPDTNTWVDAPKKDSVSAYDADLKDLIAAGYSVAEAVKFLGPRPKA